MATAPGAGRGADVGGPDAAAADAAGTARWAPILRHGLRAVFVGYNPSPHSFASGHHYAHPGNRFWALLAAAGLTPVRLRPEDDLRLPELGYGFTDVAARATPDSGALRPEELRAGGACVRAELARHRPRIAAYTGKGVYRAVADLPASAPVAYGLQHGQVVAGVLDFVLPSPSGRSGMPFEDKAQWYAGLAALLGRLDAGG